MTLSKSKGNVAWELNELLAADRRARAFNEATVEGSDSGGSPGFETMHWEQIGKKALEEALRLEREAREAAAETADSAEVGDDEVADETAPFDVEAELQARFEEGVEEGKRLAEAAQGSQQETHERLLEALAQHFGSLPAVWPIVTDLSLDIAKTVCLQSLTLDPGVFRDYVARALEDAELPNDLPVEIRLSEATALLVDQDTLAAKFPEQHFSIVVDTALVDGDITVAYDQVTVDRLLEREFEQLREQLIAQFPDQNGPA
jgi:flagellar biosynthesis/type III secretory pathway protein FliH